MDESVNEAKTSVLAVWSLVLGILSLLCFGLFAGIPAIICGHKGRSSIKQSNQTLTGGGIALAGLILGYIGTFIVTTAIIAAIAVSNYIAYKKKAFCSRTEAAAHHAKSAVSCYIANPEHQTLLRIEQLVSDNKCQYVPDEREKVYISGNSEQIQITAVDIYGRCPLGQQYIISMPENVNDGWQ